MLTSFKKFVNLSLTEDEYYEEEVNKFKNKQALRLKLSNEVYRTRNHLIAGYRRDPFNMFHSFIYNCKMVSELDENKETIDDLVSLHAFLRREKDLLSMCKDNYSNMSNETKAQCGSLKKLLNEYFTCVGMKVK